ncbi:MAG: hypothetical protein SGARI_001373 [Bacillariaceae sp.]
MEESNDLQEAKIDILTRTIREELDEKWHKMLDDEKETTKSSIFSFPFLWSTSSTRSERTTDETTVAEISHSDEANIGSVSSPDDIESCVDKGEDLDCDLIDADTSHLVDQMIHLTTCHSSDVDGSEDDDSRLTGLESCSVEDFSAMPTEEILDTVIDLTVDHEEVADCGGHTSPVKKNRFWSLKGTWKSTKPKSKHAALA